MSITGLQTYSPPVTPLALQSLRVGRISGFGFDQYRRRLGKSQGRARRPATETNVRPIASIPRSEILTAVYFRSVKPTRPGQQECRG